MQRQPSSTQWTDSNSAVIVKLLPAVDGSHESLAKSSSSRREALGLVLRLVCFFGIIAVAVFGLNAAITSGLRKIKTSQYGASNLIMDGKVNAEIIITGSSRASSHYDPRIIEAETGRTAFNLGRNGSQTDMQVAVLEAYLEHNRKPQVIIHNLDAFSFETTHEVYAPAQYVPYLYDPELYQALEKINQNTWKSRYVPLYGYVVDDMNFSWISGLKGLFGWSPPEDFFLGFNPRSKRWTDDFQRFRAANPNGVSWPIESSGIQALEDLARLCQQRGIPLIFVYSPEYREMQKLTNNRAEVFDRFSALASRYGITLWDYSDWEYAANVEYFTNSQHLNAEGASVFSRDVANRLKGYLVGESQAGSVQPSTHFIIASRALSKP